jgi:hypothetical protein
MAKSPARCMIEPRLAGETLGKALYRALAGYGMRLSGSAYLQALRERCESPSV